MSNAHHDNRPLSPHLTIYRPEITSVLSILNRLTGVALTLGAVLVVWWFLAAATGPEYFATADGVLNSILGGLVMIGSLWALWFHFCNGIRHLVWDTGRGFELEAVTRSGIAVVVASVVLTVITLFVAF